MFRVAGISAGKAMGERFGDWAPIDMNSARAEVSDAPREEHQAGRCLSIFKERPARCAYLRTHGQPTRQIRDLGCARGYGKVRWDFSSADPVPETALQQRRAARGRILQEPLNLSVVHKRGDAHQKAAPGGAFLGRTFDVVLQKVRNRVAKAFWRKECFGCENALPFCVPPEDAQEDRPLVSEDGIQAGPSHTHPGDEIVNRHSVVPFRPEHLSRLLERPRLVEAARPSPRPGGFLNHLVLNSLTPSILPI